jgi:glycosyltransferase involved in cell wall biosynthesis
MKKICYFINSDWYFELHWIERARAAMAAGNEIHVISHFTTDAIKSKLSTFGIICHDSNLSEQSVNPAKFLLSLFRIWKLLKCINPDLLHCITIKPCLIGGLFARRYHKPIIISFVGLGRVFVDAEFHMKIIRWLTLRCYKEILKNKKCLLTFEHERDRNTLCQMIHIDPIQTVIIDGAGINTDVFRYSLEPLNEKPVVLFASRLLWSKGLGDLVEVKQQLARKGINFELNVAGISVVGDPDAIPLTQIELWQQQGLINWLGQCSDMFSLIESSNIVALPSVYSEGIPRILLEASSVGRTCIAYDVGGCQSLIINDYNGNLVEMHNLTLFAEKLEYLISHPTKRIEMGLRSRERVENKFASSLIIKDTLDLYERATATGSNGNNMIKKIVVEIPIAWMENPLDGPKNQKFISNFLIALTTRNIPVYLLKVPFGSDNAPRMPQKGVLVFSYHSRGEEKNVWHLKESPVTPLYSIDRAGYSGWADISSLERYQRRINAISSNTAREIIEQYRDFFHRKGLSKYPQPVSDDLELPEKFVFFPLQVIDDPVSKLSQLSMLDILQKAADCAREQEIYLLVKRHPFCRSLAVEKVLSRITRENPWVKQVDANVHILIQHAHAVVTVNSGVGIEALLGGAAVYASGLSEWYRAANRLNSLDDVVNAFSEQPVLMDTWQEKLLAFLVRDYWVDPDDLSALDVKINDCIADFDPNYGIDGATIEASEVLLPIILDLQGRLEYESRRAKLALTDLDVVIKENSRLERENQDLVAAQAVAYNNHNDVLTSETALPEADQNKTS